MMEETKATVRVIASDENWIEGDALQQLDKTASWQGMRLAVGMPDLHPGKGTPVGAAFVSEGIFYPYLVGNDIGCGMGLWATDLKTKKVRLDRWTDRLVGLEIGWDGDVASQLAADGAEPSGFEEALGTIGGGNHFAELQKIASIEVPEVADGLGLRRDRLVLLVHSGSRGFGESILRKHIDRFKAGGLEEGSEAAVEYLDRHDKAVAWARVNRRIIAKRFLSMLGGDGERSLDVCHNFVERMPFGDGTAWIHRKGAAPSNQGIAVIPGSRGALSYVVEPTGDQSLGAWSLAHGAGRKWARSDAKARLKRFRADQLTRTALGSRVICEDKRLLFEEAPQAYKNIDVVVGDLVDAGLVRVVATLEPVITYKVRTRG